MGRPIKSLIGIRFGRLVVEKQVGTHPTRKFAIWECKCDCGQTKSVGSPFLTTGGTKSCGCWHKENCKNLKKQPELIGQRFGKLVVVSRSKNVSKRGSRYLCQCDCGKQTIINGSGLLRKYKWQSCGCTIHENSGQFKLRYTSNIALNSLVSNYRRSAIERGYEFSLTHNDCESLFSQKCFYCSSEPKQIFKIKTYSLTYNGIDRLDNSIGYSKDNTVPCCKICNRAKNSMSLNEFQKWIQALKSQPELGCSAGLLF